MDFPSALYRTITLTVAKGQNNHIHDIHAKKVRKISKDDDYTNLTAHFLANLDF